jgi:hypothetical protein
MSLQFVQNRVHGNYDVPASPTRRQPDTRPTVIVRQTRWVAQRLTEDQYLYTYGLASCTGFALVDTTAKVFGLAHFDGSQNANEINAMFHEMIHHGASAENIRCVIAGTGYVNQTALGVYNSLQGSDYAATPVTVYESQGELAVFGDGTVCRFT